MVAVAVSVFLLGQSAAYGATGYSSSASLTITGRGRAHGVGLCMTSVMNMSKKGWKYTSMLPYFYRGTRVQYKKGLPRNVRVGVYRTTGSISVSGGIGSSFSIRTASNRQIWPGGAGREITVSYSPSTKLYSLTLKRNGTVIGSKRIASVVRIVPSSGTILKVVNDGRMYRGNIELRWGAASKKMWAVNSVAIELYLRGIGEEPESWPFEGLKTLAVVSRGYAAYRALNPKHSGDGFAICNTGDCQAYVGYNYERNAPRLTKAVQATSGRVVTYRGALVVTPYFSNSGGMTESIQYVWGGSAKPWLRAVRTGYAKPHEAYSWSVPLSFQSLRIRLARSSATKLSGDLVGFRILSTGVSPRIRTMQVVGSGGTKTASGATFQKVLNLQSTWFRFDMPPRMTSVSVVPASFSPDGDYAADLTRVYFTLSEYARVNLRVYDASGAFVYSSAWVPRRAGRTYLAWHGKNGDGDRMPDGRYRFLVTALDGRNNRNYTGAWVTVNTLLSFVRESPSTITPNGDGIDDTTTISFVLARPAATNVQVKTSSGSIVRSLMNQPLAAGSHDTVWDGRNGAGTTVAAGTYLYSVSADDGTYSSLRSRRIVVSR